MIDSFLSELNRKRDRYITIDEVAVEYLQSLNWPGNIRQLNQYLKILYFNCLSENQTRINVEQIKKEPIENTPIYHEEDFERLNELLLLFLNNWSPDKDGKFLDNFVEPIIAKLYLDDFNMHWNKTQKNESASVIVGMDGTQFSKSKLNKAYNKYGEIKKKFNL